MTRAVTERRAAVDSHPTHAKKKNPSSLGRRMLMEMRRKIWLAAAAALGVSACGGPSATHAEPTTSTATTTTTTETTGSSESSCGAGQAEGSCGAMPDGGMSGMSH